MKFEAYLTVIWCVSTGNYDRMQRDLSFSVSTIDGMV